MLKRRANNYWAKDPGACVSSQSPAIIALQTNSYRYGQQLAHERYLFWTRICSKFHIFFVAKITASLPCYSLRHSTGDGRGPSLLNLWLLLRCALLRSFLYSAPVPKTGEDTVNVSTQARTRNVRNVHVIWMCTEAEDSNGLGENVQLQEWKKGERKLEPGKSNASCRHPTKMHYRCEKSFMVLHALNL